MISLQLKKKKRLMMVLVVQKLETLKKVVKLETQSLLSWERLKFNLVPL